MKRLITLLILACSMNCFAQQDSIAFSKFLSNFKQVYRYSFTVFGEQSVSDILDKKANEAFLPEQEKECLCNTDDIFWHNEGGYYKKENFIILFLKRHCGAYKDANEKFFVENMVSDYMLITYTNAGKIIDYKSLGREGGSFRLNIESENGVEEFVSQEGYLTDAEQVFTSDTLCYTTYKRKTKINNDGTISTEMIGEPFVEKVDYGTHEEVKPEDVVKELTAFYKAYMTDGTNKDSLQNIYLTESMRAKMERLAQVTNADVLLRAQDYSEYGRESVSVKHLDWYWYEVSYQFAADQKVERIPVRISDAVDGVHIHYVVPAWGGTTFGDSLLTVDYVKVEEHDAEQFIQSFYHKYTNLYIEMLDNLDEELHLMRERYCTNEFKTFYDSIHNELLTEYAQNCYDAVIDNYDFDTFWRPSLKIEPVAPLQYKVSYSTNNEFIVTLKNVDGFYKIDKIKTKMEETMKKQIK